MSAGMEETKHAPPNGGKSQEDSPKNRALFSNSTTYMEREAMEPCRLPKILYSWLPGPSLFNTASSERTYKRGARKMGIRCRGRNGAFVGLEECLTLQLCSTTRDNGDGIVRVVVVRKSSTP